jgi:peptide/nickel transport system permease protein
MTAAIISERLVRRRRWRASELVIAAPAIVFVVAAVVGPMLLPYDSVKVRTGDRLRAPFSRLEEGGVTLLGTDSVGRDIMRQVISGARVSLVVGAATVLLAGLVGTLIGLACGYLGGSIDAMFMRIADIQLSLPSFLLAMLIAGALGPSITNVVITLALTRWVVFARIVRGTTMSVRGREYVESATVLGVRPLALIRRHILPAAYTPLTVVATVQFGLVILAESSLSFLGFGSPDSTPSWGLIISDGRDLIARAWWISTIPGIALALVVISLGLLGDRLRDRLDPRLRT